MSLCIIGVRHHSPACARLVAERIRSLRPAHVLIEGPADFNERMDELFLPHALPVAIYTYLSDSRMHHGCWTPLAEHSPEWQALVAGREVGAQLRFIDLPGWHRHMQDMPNRYADQADAQQQALVEAWENALQQRLHIEDSDTLWDHLFEDDSLPLPELQTRLHTYFERLRGDTPGSIANQQREAMMARWIAWAMAQVQGTQDNQRQDKQGGVLVVCGGYHAPALARLWPDCDGQLPATPTPWDNHEPGETAQDDALRHGSYLVPYSFKRLDAFTGYASGMPSPAYYQWLFEGGHAHAGQALLQAVTSRLRGKKLPASTADVIALHTRAQALARLRGHPQPQRRDWLDALAGALIKEGLDAPLPWTYRGPLLPGTDPILVEIMDVLCGQQHGRIDPQTPQPPLVHAVREALGVFGLEQGNHQRTLHLLDAHERECSRLLHCLRILEIPGFQRTQGPQMALSGEFSEEWKITTPYGRDAALIEAGAFGATPQDAARAKLEQQLSNHLNSQSANLPLLARLLNEAAWAGLSGFAARLHSQLRDAIAAEQQFEHTGQAIELLYSLWQHGQMLGMQGAPVLGECIVLAWQRALWLLEAPAAIAPAQSDAHILGHQALRRIAADALVGAEPFTTGDAAHDADLAETAEAAEADIPTAAQLPGLDPALALAVWQRKAADGAAAPISRGASLGASISLAHLQPAASAMSAVPATHATNAVATSDLLAQSLQLLEGLPPAHLGDALAGLLALARQQLRQQPDFIAALDVLVQGMDDHAFISAMPAMRGAFAWLPARERGELAGQILQLHGAQHLSESTLTRRDTHPEAADPLEQAKAQLQERQAMQELSRWGIVWG